ncbi:MAG: hypothetical protein IT393_03650 [Nitrospirae bacterium]|nr:hypothetical protein [Nitrospirota bacterium]
MKNDIGKKNMIFGFAYFITTLLLGMYLAATAMEAGPNMEEDPLHDLLGTAHAHGNLESFLNIVIGYLLCKLDISSGLAQTVSILLIIGAIFHSGMLYLTGVGVGFAINLAPIGAISLVITMAMMVYVVAVGFKKQTGSY